MGGGNLPTLSTISGRLEGKFNSPPVKFLFQWMPGESLRNKALLAKFSENLTLFAHSNKMETYKGVLEKLKAALLQVYDVKTSYYHQECYITEAVNALFYQKTEEDILRDHKKLVEDCIRIMEPLRPKAQETEGWFQQLQGFFCRTTDNMLEKEPLVKKVN